MRKRMVSLLLCVVMLAGLLPTTAMAANDTMAFILGVQLEEGYYSTEDDYTLDDGTVIEGTHIDMESRSDTAPEGRNNYLHYQDGVLTVFGKVYIFASHYDSMSAALRVTSGTLTVKGSGSLSLYGSGVPALRVSSSAVIAFDLTPNGSDHQLTISSTENTAVKGDLTILDADGVLIGTSHFLSEDSTEVYHTIDGSAVIHANKVGLSNGTNGACIQGDLTVEADSVQIINESKTTAALTGGTYRIETDDLNMRNDVGPTVNGPITLSPVEGGKYGGNHHIYGCTTGKIPVVEGNVIVEGSNLTLWNNNYYRDSSDDRYAQYRDNPADGPLLVGDLTATGSERISLLRDDDGTMPLVTGNVSLTDCLCSGSGYAVHIDRGTGSGAAVSGNITMKNSTLFIYAESESDDLSDFSSEPGITGCTLTMENSSLAVWSCLDEWNGIDIKDDYEWYVYEYSMLTNPTYIKSTDKPYTNAESPDGYRYLEIRSGDKMGVRAAFLSGEKITGTALQPVSATLDLSLTGDRFDFSKLPGYREITVESEWGEWTASGIPAGTELTEYLALDKPQGGIWKLTTAEDAYQDDNFIRVTISGTAGGTNCSEPVTLTISGEILASGEDLAVTPDENVRWDITGSPTQATEYDLWVYGERVTSRNQADILKNGMASFDPQTGTLFLKNADLQGEIKDPVIKSGLDALTLSVTGQNTLRCMEGVVIDAKGLTVMPADAASSLTVRSDQAAAFARNPVLPNGAEIWTGDSMDELAYTLLPSYTASKCVKVTLHEMQKTWTYDSEKHWHACAHAGCTHKTGMAGHTLQWVVDTPAFGTNPGLRHQECTVCAYRGEKVELPCIKPIIETESLPSATKNVRYSAFIEVIGTAPLQWKHASGTLPTGLTLNQDTGEISGTPKETGTFVFTVKVINKIGEAVKTYSITVNPGMDISKLFTEKKTGCTNGSKDISQANGEKVIKKNQQYDFLYAAISHSMRNASQKEFDAIAGKLYNVLYKAAFRPRCFGATRNTIATWPLQNAGNCGTSVEDAGLGQTVKFASSKGCASYAHFVSNYVYGKDGKSSYSKGVRIESDADKFKKYFEANVDPGETINYNYKNGRMHWIVFLGESEDEQGFYFISYEGGQAKKGGPFHNLNVGYWTYRAFAAHVDNKSLCHWDTNKGSFSSGKYTALKIVSHCPVEMIVACGDEVLDSRDLNGSKTTALGTMTAMGEGANRSVTVDLNTDAGSFDLTLIGTDNGVMDLTVTHIYVDEEGKPQELTRQYSSVPVIRNGQITGLIPVDGDQTIQLDVPDPTLESGMEYWLANPGDNVTGPEEGYYPYNPAPDDNETPNSSSGSSGSSSVSNPSSVMVENIENGHVTISPKTASKGDTVTLTVCPDKGYTLETLTVTDKNGNEIELTDKGDGRYTFKMPGSKVTVKATFMEDNSMLNFFVDVPADAYYHDAVLWAAENGITGGVDDTHFAPNASCTRAQAVTFLWRVAGSPVPKTTAMPFADVKAGSYYYDAVLWAVEQGVTKGTSDTTFSPNATCTRAQIVTFLWRSQKSPAADGVNPFTDVAADAYYNTAVLWAAENGITGGTTATTFSPNNDCTRAQIVTFLFRCLGGE
ncbi:MAG: S-layer homology domain-containing protein [Dysosmobacter sp.]|nr:S-layer homology domain-containing protein [Dysosmobacter sp.]